MTPYRKNITYRQYFWGVRPSRLRGLSSPNCHRTSKGKFNFRSWKRSACARPPSKLQVAVAKTTRSCETSWKHCAGVKSWKRSSRASHPSGTASWMRETEAFVQGFLQKPASWRCETEAFVQGFLQKLQFEVVKTKLLCETSFENYKLPLPQRRFRGQTAACATLGLCDLRGTLRHYH